MMIMYILHSGPPRICSVALIISGAHALKKSEQFNAEILLATKAFLHTSLKAMIIFKVENSHFHLANDNYHFN
jgi:hypothetical protein